MASILLCRDKPFGTFLYSNWWKTTSIDWKTTHAWWSITENNTNIGLFLVSWLHRIPSWPVWVISCVPLHSGAFHWSERCSGALSLTGWAKAGGVNIDAKKVFHWNMKFLIAIIAFFSPFCQSACSFLPANNPPKHTHCFNAIHLKHTASLSACIKSVLVEAVNYELAVGRTKFVFN